MFVEIHREAYDRLPFVLNNMGCSPMQGPIFRPAGFGYHHLLWVERGEGEFTVGRDSFSLCAGQGVFLRRKVPHSYQGADFDTRWLTFSLDDGVLDFLGIGDYLKFDLPAYLPAEAEELERLAVGESTVVSRSAAGYSLVMNLLSYLLSERRSPAEAARLYLERRCGEPLTLDDVAAAAGIDRYALCRCYRREWGRSVMEDLLRIRIAKAKRLLRYPGLTLGEVGRQCGFESHSYFTLRFREQVGCTPTEYRRRHL